MSRRGAVSLRIERVERLDPEVASAVTALVERAEVHERRSPIGEHKLVGLIVGEEETFALLGWLGVSLVAYAQASRFHQRQRLPSRLAAELLVDPAHRGRGIGRGLLDRLVAEARAAGVERLDAWAHHADPAATALAAACGMRPTRRLWQMARPLDRVAPRHRSPPPLPGVRLRNYARADADAVAAVVRDAFPEHPENADFSRADLDARSALDWFDPSAILLATDEHGGELLGLHWLKLDADARTGEVYLLAVSPRAQGRGLGRWLLLTGLEEMRRRSARLAYLYVEADNAAAIELYREAGFRREHLDTCYSLPLV